MSAIRYTQLYYVLVFHKLDEANPFTGDIFEAAECLSFSRNSITKIRRLGQRYNERSPYN